MIRLSACERQVLDALLPVRLSLQADHVDLEVVDAGGVEVSLRLVFTDETCLDCLMPTDVLAEVMLSNLQRSMSEVTRVHLDDPRATRDPRAVDEPDPR